MDFDFPFENDNAPHNYEDWAEEFFHYTMDWQLKGKGYIDYSKCDEEKVALIWAVIMESFGTALMDIDYHGDVQIKLGYSVRTGYSEQAIMDGKAGTKEFGVTRELLTKAQKLLKAKDAYALHIEKKVLTTTRRSFHEFDLVPPEELNHEFLILGLIDLDKNFQKLKLLD